MASISFILILKSSTEFFSNATIAENTIQEKVYH